MALIIVLAILVLVTALVVGFLVRTGSERAAASNYRATARTRQLADTVVNLVQAQINQATTAVTSGSNTAWASQPGAIRVFDPLGNQSIYKLYSSATMVTTDYSTISTDMPAVVGGSSSWMSSPSLWVDLNAPAAFTISGSASLAYPILDPRNPAGGDFTTGTLDGFQVNPAQVGLVRNTNNPIAPMPAQWLYVLQDGTIVPPSPQSTGTSVILTATNVSATNPIVGRIAFWTDDDTCRVNINTAGDGTFWDTPRFSSNDDVGVPTDPGGFNAASTLNGGLAWSQPANWEYQRYPGHPGMTSLLLILNAVNSTLFPANSSYNGLSSVNPVNNNPFMVSAYQNLFALTPQYTFGGSKEGTVAVNSTVQDPPTNNRLYSSVGELLYSASSTAASPPVRYPSGLARAQLEAAKFFLTAHSRAPELNLFGEPRVSMWPVNPGVQPLTSTSPVPVNASSGVNVVTPIDQLLAFCATISSTATGTKQPTPYYFMRTNSGGVNAGSINATTDINLPVSIGGVQTAQNQVVLNYLDYLTSLNIPGFGGNFDGKYNQLEMRQILAEIFDYVRITNVEDGNVDPAYTQNLSVNSMYNPGVYAIADPTFGANFGWVVPSLIPMSMWTIPNTTSFTGTLEGFGTFPKPASITIQFVEVGHGAIPIVSNGVVTGTLAAANIPATELNYWGAAGLNDMNSTLTSGSVPAGVVAVQAFVSVDMINPAASRILCVCPNFWIGMGGLNYLTLNGVNMGFNPQSSCKTVYSANLPGTSGPYGSDQFQGFLPAYAEMAGRVAHPFNNGYQYYFPFYSSIMAISATNGTASTMQLGVSGSTGFNVYLYDTSGGASAPGNLIQTVSINVSGSNPNLFPVPIEQPGVNTTGTNHRIIGTGYSDQSNTQENWPQQSPVNNSDRWVQNFVDNTIDNSDDMESFVLATPQWSDPRVLAIANVPSTAFVTHRKWGQQWAYDWCYSNEWFSNQYLQNQGTATQAGSGYPDTSGAGSLVPGAAYNQAYPAVESAVNGVNYGNSTGNWGDWDNGISRMSDGPWINRPDEGGVQDPSSLVLYVNGAIVEYGTNYVPYYTGGNGVSLLGAPYFSPNREIPSPVMFGSLPTGVDPTGVNPQPWQTLLFRPGPPGHPGSVSPQDHLLLDLFWMPAAEPYAISEPFSTAGKVNLNYQILPYGYVSTSTGTVPYLKRDTAIRSALAPERIAEIPLSEAGEYKNYPGNWNNQWLNELPTNARFPVNLDQTLQQFDNEFSGASPINSKYNFFRSASELCDLYLVPQDDPANSTLASISGTNGSGWWYGSDFAMIGTNVRDRPYADLYSRVTTKSNSFTVYYTVQELKNSPATPPSQWNESTGTVVGEYRGSTDMERYIQQNTAIPNYMYKPSTTIYPSLENYYRWRILETNQFAP